MANYKFYFARSKKASTDPSQSAMAFHLRIYKVEDDGQQNSAPYLHLDQNRQPNIITQSSYNADQSIYHLVTVWLEEKEINNPSILKDFLFVEKNPKDPKDCCKAKGNLLVHIKRLYGMTPVTILITREIGETSTTDDLIYPDMPAEFPIVDTD